MKNTQLIKQLTNIEKVINDEVKDKKQETETLPVLTDEEGSVVY